MVGFCNVFFFSLQMSPFSGLDSDIGTYFILIKTKYIMTVVVISTLTQSDITVKKKQALSSVDHLYQSRLNKACLS